MISSDGIKAIIDQYKKFGWRLRRVLLTPELKKQVDGAAAFLFGDVEIVASDLDAAWFSRPSRGNGVAWEIRRLGDFPFALVEVIDVDAAEDTADEVFSRLESDLRQRINKGGQMQ